MNQQKTVFELIGGEPALRGLVDQFYDFMETDPRFAEIRALHPSDLGSSRDKLFWFLCGWSGGPNHYIERFGHPRLRARHLPFRIAEKERDQWLACMDMAMSKQQVERNLHRQLQISFTQTADWMRNHPSNVHSGPGQARKPE